MNNNKWRHIGLSFMLLTGVLLLLLFQLSLRINKIKSDNYIKSEQIAQITAELDNALIYLDDFCFNQIELRATTRNNVIAIGDTLEVSIGIFSMNFITCDNADTYEEPVILLAAGVDNKGKLVGPFDTIPSNSWEGILKVKAKELGAHQISGLYQFPNDNNFRGMSFPFFMKYTVVDNATYKSLINN